MVGATRAPKAFLAAAFFAVSADASLAGPESGLTSADLLNEGFKLVAEGDLLTVRAMKTQVPLMDEGILVGGTAPTADNCAVYDNLIASIYADYYRCKPIAWIYDRYDEYVRLKRGPEEFVCVLSPSERCYRAYN
ncbi:MULTISPECIES: hypothetical protein [unclassified Mesorhizobium]|nr:MULTISPECIES: hypothetical protein [unclassified Mesorhizobium]PBB83461.1 hypothetical protein CK216_28550 [Mesorhizobium sp. WSM3876]TGS67724.1 hypothetical protein EN844_16060 [Mesorhizobium sp. M3A.F.Ca.ET.201.01.1.1]TGT58853.1 hypothetical protein EN813_033015 [Mesorhizobium sp. M00.F.Ca.ET.170.01.1.1]RWB75039.1 MAG: hypothetical protein EOQ49_06620 [Mesorhizobium sp.]RWE23472.1 MAG: hypothetical protein EOS41_20780 [Mesorhizobium sp.]